MEQQRKGGGKTVGVREEGRYQENMAMKSTKQGSHELIENEARSSGPSWIRTR